MNRFLLLIFSIIAPYVTLKSENIDNIAWRILTESPEYQLETYSLESVEKSSGLLSNLPDPEVSGEYLIAPISEDNRWAAELTWGMEWPGVYGARSKEGRLKTEAANKMIMSQRSRRFAEIKDILLDYVQCRLKLSLLKDLKKSNDSIYSLTEMAAEGGELTVLDLNKLKLEYANIRGGIATLLDEESEIVGSLSKIYGRDCSVLLQTLQCSFPEISVPTPEELVSLKRIAPGVESAIADAEVARQRQTVARMEALPSLSLGYKHAYEDGTHFNGAILGISIPLFSSRGKQKAARADILEAEYKAEVATTEREVEIISGIKKLQLLVSQINEISPLLENQDYNSILLKAYKGGVLTLIDYLTERNYFTTAAIDLVTLRHAAAKTYANLQTYIQF